MEGNPPADGQPGKGRGKGLLETLSLNIPELFPLTAPASTGLVLKYANTQAYLRDWLCTRSMAFPAQPSLEEESKRLDGAVEWVPDLE